jgi:phosphoribosylaminoimidazole-succinocarboxamide synthase
MTATPKRGFPGRGLAKGLAVTLRTMTRRSVTDQYPDTLPELPPEIVSKTRAKYIEAFERLTGETFAWK